ncbi:MAG: alkaline shock response membrane anchor protein AmaP [Bacillota bacterium]
MKIIHKLVLVILLIILMFVSLILTIYSFGITGELFISLIEQDLYQNYILGFVFLVITILSALAIYPLLKSSNDTTVLQTGENGNINISLKAIDKIVRNVTKEQEGFDIKDIKLDARQNRLYIELVITVKGDLSIPEASSNLKNSIKERLNKTVGTDLAEIKVLIDNVDSLSKKNIIKKEKSEVNIKEDTDLENKDDIKNDNENDNDEEKVDAKDFLDDFNSKE